VVSKGATVTLQWVLGHTDIVGNKLADKLAKDATKHTPISEKDSFARLGLKFKQTRQSEWNTILDEYSKKPNTNPAAYTKKYPWKLASKIQIPPGTKRELASSLYQLKLGHGYFKSYLYRLSHSDSDTCSCGKRETPEHLLLSCSELHTARKQLMVDLKSTRLSLPLLLHTKIGIKKTLVFLKAIGIATRKWHLERSREVEVVEE